ncbi:MAG: phosphoenolpyruvate--protein phosphotransferase [Elusimicrobia bacterium]|nr:phosphoenolpyruvate--protein phosphotransferase [Elusimicrobiota bacterium]
MIIKKGVAASIGIAIGKAYIIKEDNILIKQKAIPKEKIKAEVKRFKDALDKTKKDLDKLKNKILIVLGKQHAKLIDVHHLILKDPLITKEVINLIVVQGINAEFALSKVLDKTGADFEKIQDEFFYERKHDLFDVGKKIILNLVRKEVITLDKLKEDVIVVAHNLYPSDTLHIRESHKVLGFCMDLGNKTSHTAIFAQSIGIPAVVGLSDISHQINTGDNLIIDGEQGVVIISPTEEVIKKYREEKERLYEEESYFQRLKGIPTVTRDGHKVTLMVNIDSSDNIKDLKDLKSDGVGLFRTESLYINRKTPPDVKEQKAVYLSVAKAVNKKTVIIRTADIGGDKVTDLGIKGVKDEENPFMGLRGIRLFIKYPDMLRTQLKAIYMSNTENNIKIMIPMVSSLNEIQFVKEICSVVKNELANEGFILENVPELGIMVETPAAALTVDSFLNEIDFVSIGTNDLVQYVLAVDRMNPYVSNLYDPYHPAVLRLINVVIQAAHKKGKHVSACGEMASDPLAMCILMGLGVDSLSVPMKMYLRVKHKICSSSFEKISSMAQSLLGMGKSEEVKEAVSEAMK